MTTRTTYDDPLSWLDQAGLDPSLRQLNFRVSLPTRTIPDGDTRAYCEAQMGEPGFERLCSHLVRPNSRYCGIHREHRRQVELFGPET
jgi:hypothetical protein